MYTPHAMSHYSLMIEQQPYFLLSRVGIDVFYLTTAMQLTLLHIHLHCLRCEAVIVIPPPVLGKPCHFHLRSHFSFLLSTASFHQPVLLSSTLCLQCGRPGFNLWVEKIPWRRKWQPTPVLVPTKSHGWRSLVQATVHGVTKSQTRLSDFTFFLSIGSVPSTTNHTYISSLLYCFKALSLPP